MPLCACFYLDCACDRASPGMTLSAHDLVPRHRIEPRVPVPLLPLSHPPPGHLLTLCEYPFELPPPFDLPATLTLALDVRPFASPAARPPDPFGRRASLGPEIAPQGVVPPALPQRTSSLLCLHFVRYLLAPVRFLAAPSVHVASCEKQIARSTVLGVECGAEKGFRR